jgi:hypothetical protein
VLRYQSPGEPAPARTPRSRRAANESHEFAPFHLIEQPSGGRTMQQTMYWLDYDAVALAVLVIGLGMIGLLALSI